MTLMMNSSAETPFDLAFNKTHNRIIDLMVEYGFNLNNVAQELFTFQRAYHYLPHEQGVRARCVQRLLRWRDDSRMLRSLPLKTRCWIQIQIHEIDTSSLPPIYVVTSKGPTVKGEPRIWSAGYIRRMRRKLLGPRQI